MFLILPVELSVILDMHLVVQVLGKVLMILNEIKFFEKLRVGGL